MRLCLKYNFFSQNKLKGRYALKSDILKVPVGHAHAVSDVTEPDPHWGQVSPDGSRLLSEPVNTVTDSTLIHLLDINALIFLLNFSKYESY